MLKVEYRILYLPPEGKKNVAPMLMHQKTGSGRIIRVSK